MDIFSHPVVATIIFLGILVFVHEAGHFLIGKLCGISVEIFSIGFGPTILSFNRQETNYRISIIPLGGYVKFYGSVAGEEVPENLKGSEFHSASVPSRLATIAAGPIANFLLAIFVFTIVGLHGMKHPSTVIGEIMPDSPAEKAGLRYMDRIVQINGNDLKTWKDLQRIVADNPSQELDLMIERDGVSTALKLVPETVNDKELARQKGRIGISPSFVPATLTILSKQSPLYLANVPQGFRVTELSWGEQSHSVKYWRDLDLLFAKIQAPVSTLKVRGYLQDPDPRKPEKENQELAEYSLDVSSLSTISTSSLGISDSQLTIGIELKDTEGVEAGDKIISWNGQKLENAFQLSELIGNNFTEQAKLELLRNGELITVVAELEGVEVQKAEGKVTLYRLPAMFWGSLEAGEFVEEKYTNIFAALGYGMRETGVLTKAIGTAVIGLFTGDMPLKALGGPIAIAKVASDSVKMGLIAFLHLLAMISINLGLLNLIPIPVLDGGQLLLVGAEGVMRRPLSEAIVEGYQKVGFVMVLALIAMATYNDLGRFWASMLKGASSIF